MRKTCLALLALCCASHAAWGQPAPAAPLDPSRDALDSHLLRWEESMKKLNSLAVACTRTEIDAVYKTRKTLTGTIHFQKPTYFFWHMGVKDKPAEYERLICTGTHIYQYLPSQKEIRYYPAPKTNAEGRLADDSSLAFLFGMKAAEAKNRYELKLHNVDANYVYVDVVPRNAVDRADFTKARLVLNKDTFLPRQLWFEHTGGEVLWDLPNVQSNAQIARGIFAPPATPKDWKLVRGQEAGPGNGPGSPQPRIIRPSSPQDDQR